MLGAIGYKTKKDIKANIGKRLRFTETNAFSTEYTDNGKVTMVGPCAYTNRKWYATITMKDGKIEKVQ
jgi:hypothetical protein